MRCGKKGKRSNEVKRNFSTVVFFYTSYTRCIKNLKTVALLGALRNLWRKVLLDKKKQWQIKWIISIRKLILSYLIQDVVPNVYTKFQNPRYSSSWEIFDKKNHLRKKEKKEKRTNKENDKHESADSVFKQYNKSYPMFVQNFKILGAIVPEKSLTKKSLYTDRQTDRHTHAHTHTQTLLRKIRKLNVPSYFVESLITVLYMYIAQGKGRYPLGDKILNITKKF